MFFRIQKKGALFYVIDALVAAAIITVTISIIFGTKVELQDSTVAEEAIGNYITILSNEQVSALLNEPITKQLIIERSITNPSNSIFEAVVELVDKDLLANASSLMQEATNIILDPQHSIRIVVINGATKTEVFERIVRERNKAKIDLNRQQAISFKREKYVELSTQKITSGRTGDDVCAPALCTYLTSRLVEPYEFNLDACNSFSFMNWYAHCRYETETELIGPVLIEVELWV